MSRPVSLPEAGVDKFEYLKRVAPDRGLTPGEFRVLVALFNFTNREGFNARPGNELLQRSSGVSANTLERALRRLVQGGYVVVASPGGRGKGGRGKATVYALAVPAHLQVVDEGVDEGVDEVVWGEVFAQETSPSSGAVWSETSPVLEENHPHFGEKPPQSWGETSPTSGDPSEYSDFEQIKHQNVKGSEVPEEPDPVVDACSLKDDAGESGSGLRSVDSEPVSGRMSAMLRLHGIPVESHAAVVGYARSCDSVADADRLLRSREGRAFAWSCFEALGAAAA